MEIINIGTVISDGKSEYVVKERIRYGGFAEVFRAENKNGESFAIKVIINPEPQNLQS